MNKKKYELFKMRFLPNLCFASLIAINKGIQISYKMQTRIDWFNLKPIASLQAKFRKVY